LIKGALLYTFSHSSTLRCVLEFVFGRKRKKMKRNKKIIVFWSFYQTEKKGNRKDLIEKLKDFSPKIFHPNMGGVKKKHNYNIFFLFYFFSS
jgi:hypothetical protein